MGEISKAIENFIAHRFSLQEDRAEELVIVESIRKNVDFKGANLWALIFAIFIASIGLNVNSTAVIIGAMLVSPIMGPVMGIGLGIGINDLELVKKGGKNLLVATLFSVLTSTIYFYITPLHEAQSELLARTSPSIWDVFIAFFGGMAGMVAASRNERSNVIPGVAIATALMPPLCTAGFGLATGSWLYCLGALYLYFINSVFIAIATFLMSRYLKLSRKHFDDPGIEKKVTRYMVIVVLITIIPSIFMAYRIVDRSIFETNARKFVDERFRFTNTQVVSRSYHYGTKDKEIDLLLIGAELTKPELDSLRLHLNDYKLQGVKLNIRQGLNAKQEIDFSQIKASIMEDVFSRQQQNDTVKQRTQVARTAVADTNVLRELKILYPAIRSFGISDMVIWPASSGKPDTTRVAVAEFPVSLKQTDRIKLQQWLQVRYRNKKVRLLTR
ncbi:TIGR00341 family protein [Mucilaginibacter daejeonensis]|uniref:TIGR00341 family protein n=1 Tax=Mucilaginibacter daejeonensis TaxID=398049 RepID=UPI001D177028|nr:TIGR00341 family protein [Mucilaginibacter daejeonensis]UEG51376.1 TIGR00341 family protein [Mucilaginibacter daejeonensis]